MLLIVINYYFQSILLRKKTNGSLNYRRTQQSQNLRRNPTLTSSTQRESNDSDPLSKHSMLQVRLQMCRIIDIKVAIFDTLKIR